jgi:hypothetical protein
MGESIAQAGWRDLGWRAMYAHRPGAWQVKEEYKC